MELDQSLEAIEVQADLFSSIHGGAEELELMALPRTAKRARSLGLTYYYTNKPCSAGHYAKRYVRGGNCIKCIYDKRGFATRRGRSKKNEERTLDAIEAGKLTYIPTKPCKAGHSEKYIGSNNCVQCQAIALERRWEKAKYTRIKKIYGLSREEYEQLLASQQNKCPICENSFLDRKHHIDHCHETGVVRGILCNTCNQGIGLLRHSAPILESAIKYLSCQGV